MIHVTPTLIMGMLIVLALLLALPVCAADPGGKDGVSSPAAPATQPAATGPAKAVPAVLDFTMKDIDGNDVPLKSHQGKVILIVNVASKCGFTPQYTALEALHDKYAGKGLAILGFPANNFGGQEPGTDPEIKAFCQAKFSVKFPLFSKISVKGDDKHPLYKFLTSQPINGKPGGEVSWNFEKFLVSRDGKVIGRFGPRITPDSKEVVEAIERELAKPAP